MPEAFEFDEFDDIDEIVEITVEGEVIQSTTGHPFWVIEGDDLDDRPRPEHIVGAHVPETTVPGRWVDSHDLRAGDVLLLKACLPTRVQAIQVRDYSGLVYNFAVEDLACYAVGECRVLVHNSCSVTNPYGKLGSPAHQAKVQDIVAEIRARGLRAETEVAIRTVNGQKATRFMDVVAIDPKTNRIVEAHQVGRVLKSNLEVPVARERSAFRDVRHSFELRDAKRLFHEY